MDLSNISIPNANLSHAVLYKTNLSNSDLSNVNLSCAQMNGADLSKTNLKGANFDLIRNIPLHHSFELPYISENEKYLITTQNHGNCYVYHAFNAKCLRRYGYLDGFMRNISISKDYSLLLTSDDRCTTIWNFRTGKKLR